MCSHATAVATVADDCDYTQACASEKTSVLTSQVEAMKALAATAQSEAAAIKEEKAKLASTTQQQLQQAAATAKAQVKQLQLLFFEVIGIDVVLTGLLSTLASLHSVAL
jgi:hypothetical protein